MSEQNIYEDFTPQKGKKSGIWKYFHFKVNRSGTREKGHVYCKICDCALSYMHYKHVETCQPETLEGCSCKFQKKFIDLY